MSARHERQWWPISSKNSSLVPAKYDVDLTRSFNPTDNKPWKHSVGMKFSSITSAMGFKSKKHPTLAIQDPPPDIRPKTARVDTRPVRYPNRPPATSVSTVQSWDDSTEPQTPLDVVKEGMPRVLTTSDPDPYSSRAIHGSPTIQDPNRLSVYSSSSISDTLSKKNESAIAFKRLSDASSQCLAVDFSPTSSSTSLHGSVNGRRPSSSSKKSNTQRRKPSLLTPIEPACSWNDTGNMSPNGQLRCPSLSKSVSSSTLKKMSRLGESDPNLASCNHIRRRGTIESRSQFLCNASSPPRTSLPPPPNDQPASPTSLLSPRVLVRQSSASRIGPPSAPPSGGLPAPPVADYLLVDDETALRAVSPGSSSSSLSFAPATLQGRIPLKEIGSRRREESPSSPIDVRSSDGHTVKKSISHQNFTRRPPYNLTTGSGSCTPAEQAEDKSPRKQRSFHSNSRIVSPPSLSSPSRQPPPPVPSQPQSPSSPELVTFAEQRRGTSVRKRLFSGGSSIRRPTSQAFSAGDDHQSVFTAESEQTQGVSFTDPVGSAKSPAPSIRDDGPFDRSPSSPGPSASDYTPQMIVSPAEMLRMEASFNEESDEYDYRYASRQRVHSLASPSTSLSDRNGSEGLSSSVSPTHYIIDRASSGAKRSPSMTRSGLSSPLRQSLRPSTSQNSMTGKSPLFPSSKPSSPSIGLPPPPRPRRQTVITNNETNATPATPPSTIRRANTTAGALVRSIMRKPSFLDIEDEAHVPQRPLSVASAFAGSFLDLDRGKDSFDTIRSEDEQEDS